MTAPTAESSARLRVEEVYRAESRRAFATLVRLIGDFDLAEEALHDAFASALEQWPREGVPANPRAWLVSTARFKAIDTLRRRTRHEASLDELARRLERTPVEDNTTATDGVEDDRLRLIFTCCHPAIDPKVQIALTLREVCGLTTEEVASAFLTAPSTMAQRIVRGKAKIRHARIPYVVPALPDLPERLDSVLSVIYLVFSEGYSASSGGTLTRPDLSQEAIRLARLLLELLPDPEVMGLLAMMLLHESRRAARTTADGDLILLENQNRTLWNQELIAEGRDLIGRAVSGQQFGVYTIQAAIAAVHANAPSTAETDWSELVGWYDVLAQAMRSPVVELNRAVAIAMRDGPAAGLELVEAILARGDLQHYHLAHATRADLCRRLGKADDARNSYQQAIALTQQEPERRFLQKRLEELA